MTQPIKLADIAINNEILVTLYLQCTAEVRPYVWRGDTLTSLLVTSQPLDCDVISG